MQIGIAHPRIVEHQAALVLFRDLAAISCLLVELSDCTVFGRLIGVHETCRNFNGDLADWRTELFLQEKRGGGARALKDRDDADAVVIDACGTCASLGGLPVTLGGMRVGVDGSAR